MSDCFDVGYDTDHRPAPLTLPGQPLPDCHMEIDYRGNGRLPLKLAIRYLMRSLRKGKKQKSEGRRACPELVEGMMIEGWGIIWQM